MQEVNKEELLYLYILYNVEKSEEGGVYSKYFSIFELEPEAVEIVESNMRAGFRPSTKEIEDVINLMLKEKIISEIAFGVANKPPKFYIQ